MQNMRCLLIPLTYLFCAPTVCQVLCQGQGMLGWSQASVCQVYESGESHVYSKQQHVCQLLQEGHVLSAVGTWRPAN